MNRRRSIPKRVDLFTCILGSMLFSTGCLNPFAPVEGEVGTLIWSDQTTVGGLLHNFSEAYGHRDSLRYADCLAESFVFHYYDVEVGRFDSWYRVADLKATSGLFRTYDPVSLEWNMIPADVESFNSPDSLIGFIVRYNLTLGQEAPLMGFAHFEVKRGEDGRFRVMTWWDDF